MVIEMYKIVRVKYKSIMFNGDEKSNVDIHASGEIHERNEKTTIYFESKEKIPFEITFNEEHLKLKQGNSQLNFQLNRKILNHYQTPYGMIEMVSLLDVLQIKENCLKIKYRLFDKEECITKVYIQMNWLNI